jgi:hypothetical protein
MIVTRHGKNAQDIVAALASMGSGPLDRGTHDAQSMTVDEIHHTGGAGRSQVQRWEIAPDLWIWRVVLLVKEGLRYGQKRARWAYWKEGTVIGCGVADSQDEAQRHGRRLANLLAKERRSAA